MALSLPIYFLGRTFVLHTRIHGRQFKRSLKTADPRVAKLRAISILGRLGMAVWLDNPKLGDFGFSENERRQYEIDIKNGIVKAANPEDHRMAMEAIAEWRRAKAVEALGPIPGGWPKSEAPAVAAAKPSKAEPESFDESRVCKAKGPSFSAIMAEFLIFKKGRSEGTKADYQATVLEFETFAGKLPISQISEGHVGDYMKWLAGRDNKAPTIDKKVGALRALFNFGKKQHLCSGENPAANRNLQSREEKYAGGHKFYELDELKQVLGGEEFKALAATEPSVHLIVPAALITGVRITALAALAASDFRVSVNGHPYIQVAKDKTAAGRRNVPIPKRLYDPMLAYIKEHGSLGFEARPGGKGASDAVRKKLLNHLESIGLAGKGFTIHGLRKTINNYLFHKKVPLETRCQFMGHKIDHVNVGVYAAGNSVSKLTIDEIAEAVAPHQEELLKLIEFGKA